MHIDKEVSQFREDMKTFMQSFLQADDQPTPTGGQPAPRKRKLCELLLVAFMRDKIAPSCDAVIAENLLVWQGWCEDSNKNLIDRFHKLMQSLKPPVFEELNYSFSKSSKLNHTSIFVIDWMVRHSGWALPLGKRDEWNEEVVLHWSDPDNTDTSDCFLERAETFLQEGARGTSWGATILGKVIQTNSYVIFLRMGALSSLLMREHCDIENRRHLNKLKETDCATKCTPPLRISLVVSSSKWHLSLGEGTAPSEAHISEIVWQLQRIASFPSEIHKANECSFSEVERVEWEPLYSLERSTKKRKYLDGGGGCGDNDDFNDNGGGDGGGEPGAAASGATRGGQAYLGKMPR